MHRTSALHRTIVAVFFALIVSTVAAAADDQWHKSYAVTGTPELVLRVDDGSVRVNASDAKEVVVNVDAGGAKIGENQRVRVEERQTGNRIEISVRVRHSHVAFSFGTHTNRSPNVDITVPRQANLDIDTRDGSLRVYNVHGNLNLHSGDGSIEGSGLDGNLEAQSGDGHIHVQGRFDQLNVHTQDGSVQADIANGSKITSTWTVRTGDGSVHMHLPQFAADLDVRTGDGHINVDLPLTVQGALERSHMRGKLNGGGPLLEVRTGDGSITIGQS